MSMQELTDDQLDGLFRKSAEEFNPPHDSAAWQAMGQLLDAHNQTIPVPKPSVWKKNSVRGLLLLFLLILSVGSWLAYRQLWSGGMKGIERSTAIVWSAKPSAPRSASPKPEESEYSKKTGSDHLQKASYSESTTKITRPTAIPVNEQSKQSMLNEQPLGDELSVSADKSNNPIRAVGESRAIARPGRTKVVDSKSSNPVALNVNSTLVKPIRNPERNDVVMNRPASSMRSRLRATSRKRGSSTNQYAIKQRPAFSKGPVSYQLTNNSIAQTIEPVPDKTAELTTMPAVAEMTSRSGQWPKSLLFRGRGLVLPDTGNAEFFRKPLVLSQSGQTGLSVRLVVAPDLSAIGLKDFQRPGTNMGLMLEYRLASRWSVQAGVIRSTKVYKALPTDYELPQGWKTVPISIDGTCNLLDIPINLRYDFALKPRLNSLQPSRWFVSGGVTTYVMLREDYTYNYAPHTYNTPPPLTKKNGGTYGFSQLNVSTGYERAINRRLSWQVEPFVKMPLKGVGYYKINLLSTGAFFSLRLKL